MGLGDMYGRRAALFGNSGEGISTPPKTADDPHRWQYYTLSDFSGGYDSSRAAEAQKENVSPYMIDTMVDNAGRIKVMPGIEVQETLDRVPTELFAHPSLDGTVDVVLVAAPKFGVRTLGVTTWYDGGLPVGAGWVSALHGEQLLLSNNSPSTDVYLRDPMGTSLTGIGWGEAGSLLSFAGRLFAFNTSIGGVRNQLGVKWTGASGLATDVSGEGSGFELLLRDSTENDRIVAAREIGFDLVAVMLRKSVWVGIPTGDSNRPVDFRPRIVGSGAVVEAAVRSVAGGVMYLSDAGVEFFDGNSVEHMSAPIDSDLLPIDYKNLAAYSATYNVATQQFLLHAPGTTWIYSMTKKRWERSSADINRSVMIYNPFTLGALDLSAGWGDYWGGFWGDVPPGGVETQSNDLLLMSGNLLGGYSEGFGKNFNSPLTPEWRSVRIDGLTMEGLVEYDRFDVEFEGDGTVCFYTPDAGGELVLLAAQKDLFETNRIRRERAFASAASGLGLGCRVVISDWTDLKIRRLGVRFRAVGERVDAI